MRYLYLSCQFTQHVVSTSVSITYVSKLPLRLGPTDVPDSFTEAYCLPISSLAGKTKHPRRGETLRQLNIMPKSQHKWTHPVQSRRMQSEVATLEERFSRIVAIVKEGRRRGRGGGDPWRGPGSPLWHRGSTCLVNADTKPTQVFCGQIVQQAEGASWGWWWIPTTTLSVIKVTRVTFLSLQLLLV